MQTNRKKKRVLRGADDPNTLMMTFIWHYLPTSRHHAYVCSSGSQGYCALKEMLENGKPGHTILLESGDLRDVQGFDTKPTHSSRNWSFVSTTPSPELRIRPAHINVSTNFGRLPPHFSQRQALNENGPF